MSQNAAINQANQLLEARKQALEESRFGKLQAHGKLWGMDVFSWPNPNLELLATTLDSFPFQVVWFGSSLLFQSCNEIDERVWINIDSIIAYDDSRLIFRNKNFVPVSSVLGFQSIELALNSIKGLRKLNCILLLTPSGTEWEMEHKSMLEYITLHQTK